MAEQFDLARLRSLLEGVVGTLYERYRHQDLPELCERLHLPPPPANDGPTKHQRLNASLQACPDGRLPQVAVAVLDSETLLTAEHHALQDVVWLGRHYVEVPGRTRRELAKALDLDDYRDYPDRFLALLGRLWDLGDDWLGEWGTPTVSLREEIARHVMRFRDDWSTEELFERLGAFEAPHPRFGRFLEGLASAAVLPDEHAQRRFVDLANKHLQPVGALLRQEGKPTATPSSI